MGAWLPIYLRRSLLAAAKVVTVNIVVLAACSLMVPAAWAIQTEYQAQSEQLLIERINTQSLQAKLGGLWVLDPVTLAGTSYIVEGEDDAQIFNEGDFIYVRGGASDDNGHYHIIKRRSTYQDPISNELLGLEVKRIGVAEAAGTPSGPRVLKITAADEPILVGYQLVPARWETKFDGRKLRRIAPAEADAAMLGQIISSVGLDSNIEVEDVVAINLGKREGMNRGDVVSVLDSDDATPISDIDVSVGNTQREVGLIYVLQTFVKMSYGVVLKADTDLKPGDRLCTADC